MGTGFTDKNGDFRPTDKPASSLHSSMLFPSKKQNSMNDEKKSHLYDFAKKALFHSGKTYGVTKGVTNTINEKYKKAQDLKSQKRNERIEGINEAVTGITEDKDTSNNEKLSKLQRLLNTSYKDMDNALYSRIKMEMQSIQSVKEKHAEHNTKAKNKSKDSQQEQKSNTGTGTFADMYDEPVTTSETAPINIDYESDTKLDDKEKPFSAQDLSVISSIQSEILK